MESGEWRMESGEWRMENGEWRMRVENRENERNYLRNLVRCKQLLGIFIKQNLLMQDHVKPTNHPPHSPLQVLPKEGGTPVNMAIRTKQRTRFHGKTTITIATNAYKPKYFFSFMRGSQKVSNSFFSISCKQKISLFRLST